MPPMAVGQSLHECLNHRHREQVEPSHRPSHIDRIPLFEQRCGWMRVRGQVAGESFTGTLHLPHKLMRLGLEPIKQTGDIGL